MSDNVSKYQIVLDARKSCFRQWRRNKKKAKQHNIECGHQKNSQTQEMNYFSEYNKVVV